MDQQQLPNEMINEIFDFLSEMFYYTISSVCKRWRILLCEKLMNAKHGLTLFKYKTQDGEWSEQQFGISLPIHHVLIVKSQFNPKYWNRFFENSSLNQLMRLKLIGVPIGNNPLKLMSNCKYLNRLEKLVLIGCGIGDAGVKFLIQSKEMSKSLKYLDLSRNGITDSGLKMLFNSKFTLEELYISMNSIKNIDSFIENQPQSMKILQIEEFYRVITVHDMHLEIFLKSNKKQEESTNDQVLCEIALMLQKPEILNRISTVSLKLLSDSALQGNSTAQFKLGGLYCCNCQPDYGFPFDSELAIEWLEKSARQNHVNAMALLSLVYEDVGDIEQSHKWCVKASELGDLSSTTRLGYMFDTGNEIVTIDHESARTLYEFVIESDPECEGTLFLLGNMYRYGRYDSDGNAIIEQDFEKTMMYYHKCLELNQDNEWANYHLGMMFKIGEGSEGPNYGLAMKYLTRSAELGNAQAQNELENMLSD